VLDVEAELANPNFNRRLRQGRPDMRPVADNHLLGSVKVIDDANLTFG